MGGRLWALWRSHPKSFSGGASDLDNGSEKAWREDGDDIRTFFLIHIRN
jgi:hypothetical protein